MFLGDRRPAQKDKRLYQNWSPRSGTKFEKNVKKVKKLIYFLNIFSCFYYKNTCFLRKIPFGVHPEGVRPFEVHPFGVHPFGVHPFGARPFGARWAGPPLLCVGWKYWKSSQEKVSRKTTLYFLEKSRFSSFSLSERSETYLKRQISSRGSGSNLFFYPKLIGER